MSDQYAHRCCKFAGNKSKSKHYAYKKSGEKEENSKYSTSFIEYRCFISIDRIWYDCILGKNIYWELTLYMDLRNNEIVGYGLSSRRGDPNTYYEGLTKAAKK